MTETTEMPLAVWMEEGGDWKGVPRESALYAFCAEAAGCDGRVFANANAGELVMCDGSDLVLWKMGDMRAPIEEARAIARKRDVSLALEIAKVAAEVALKAVLEEREACAQVADDMRGVWNDSEAGMAGAAVCTTIARAIRKRGEGDLARFKAELDRTPERGGVVDDAGPGGDRPSQPPPVTAHHVPANNCPSCGKTLDAATNIEGEGEAPEPGNITVCMHCGHIMAFADDLSLRELTDEEAHAVAGDPLILRAQRIHSKFLAAKEKGEPPWQARPQDDSEPPSPTPPKND